MDFLEEEHAPHPYTNFNKQPDGSVSTLTGNWVEERALKEVTGTTRYQVSHGGGSVCRTFDQRGMFLPSTVCKRAQ